jgi:hypothetical protein
MERDMNNAWISGPLTLGVALGGLLAVHSARAVPPNHETPKPVNQITCEEFLALSPDHQERVAYWVDGYRLAKGEEVIGTVGFDKFDRPVAALVEDCKRAPHETLWQKVKKHL